MSGATAQVSEHIHARNEGCNITLLARDPNWLYVYWEISERKNAAFQAELGEELWKKSTPCLKVTNITRNESFFVRINEFSDNWYINVQDSNNIYLVEIGRKISDSYFISMSGSNSIVTPSDCVSRDTTACFVNYTDLKNGRFEFQTGKVYTASAYIAPAYPISGMSSPELYGKGGNRENEEGFFGKSSAELFGINLQELPGVSSDSFLKG